MENISNVHENTGKPMIYFTSGRRSVKPTKKVKSQRLRQLHQVYQKKKSFPFMLNQTMIRWTREEERELKKQKVQAALVIRLTKHLEF
jgi:hypothetical protein